MAKSTQTLRVNITGDAKQLQGELDGVEGKLKNFGGGLQRSGKTMSKWVTGPIVGGAMAVGGLALKTSKAADEVAKASRAAGLSTDAFQELEYAFGQAGIESADFEKGTQRFNRRMGEAVDGTGSAAGAVETLGLKLEDANGNMRDTDDVMDDAIKKLADVEDPARRAALAGDLFGNRLGPEMAAALEDGSGAIDEAREKAHDLGIVMSGESTEAAEEFQDKLDDLQRGFGGMVQGIGEKVIPLLTDELIPAIEEHVVPMFESFGEKISDVVSWFTDLEPRTRNMIVAGLGLAAALGPVLIVVGKLVSAIAPLIGMVKAVGAVIAAIASPIGIVVLAIGALVAGLVLAYQRSETFRDIVDAAWERIKDAISTAWEDWIKPAFHAIADYLVNVAMPRFLDMKDTAEDVWDNISKAVKFAWDRVIKPVWDAIKKFIDNMLVPTFEFFFRVGKAVWEDIASLISNLWNNNIKPAWEAVKGFIDDNLVPVFETMQDVAETVWEAITGAVESAWETVEPVFTALWEFIEDKLSPVWDTFKEAAEDAWGSVVSIIGGALRTLGSMVSSFLGVAASIADFIGMSNLAGVLQSGADSAATWGAGFNRGGMVPGGGPDRDSVPAMLTPGEFVLNRRAAQRIPDDVLRKLNDPSWSLSRRGMGGTGGDLGDVLGYNAGGFAKTPDEVLDEARRQSGPYQWGGFGPRFDCSGFMAWLSNYAATGNGRSGGRWATGMATGRNKVGRFEPGEGDPETGFSIGIRPSGYGGRSIGHTAGTVAGVNVESAGGIGSHVGGHRGYRYGPYRYHLPDFGGPSAEMLGWWSTIGDSISGLGDAFDNPAANMFRETILSAVSGAAEWLLDKVPFGGVLRDIAGLAEGGTTSSAGSLRVGEDGPELVTLPKRATVSPENDVVDLLRSIDRRLAKGGGGPLVSAENINIEDGMDVEEFGRRLAAAARL